MMKLPLPLTEGESNQDYVKRVGKVYSIPEKDLPEPGLEWDWLHDMQLEHWED